MARRRAWGSIWVVAALVVLLSTLFPVATQAASPLTFDPVADAQVNSGNANGNYGSLSTIRTRQGSGGTSDPIYRSYLTFDVTGLAGQTVTGVTLRLYVTDASSNGQAVYAVSDTTWPESGLTYANAPALGGSALATVPVPTLNAYVDLPLPASAVTGDGRVSFAVRSTGTDSAIFSSREGSSPPRLVVESGPGGGTPTPTPTPTPPGATPTPTPTPTPTATPTPTGPTGGVTLTPIADAQVNSRATTTNYGTLTSLRTREDPNSGNSSYRSYLMFDVSGRSGPAQTVRLRLFVTDATKNAQGIYAIGDTSWSETGITFGNAPAITGTALATPTPSSTNAYIDIDLPASAIPDNGRYAFAIKGSGTDSLYVNSREASTNKPQLVIDGGGTPPPTPAGAFVANPSSGTAPLTVVFTDQSTNSPTSWSWTFDDPGSGSSNSSTLRNPTHTFASAGSYDVTLTPSNGSGTGTPVTHTITVTTSGGGGSDPVLVGAGDIAVCGRTQDDATADLLDGIAGTVFTAGDNVYENGTLSEYNTCYGPSWGRHKARTRPVAGNHEYQTANAAGYFAYFGSAAGDPSKGYYSFDLGAWHAVVLNSNCSAIGGCGATSAQGNWLKADLAAHPASCTVAIWHHPRFSSSQSSNDGSVLGLWQVLYDAGADLVLVGHRHNYERFAPQTPAGATDPSFGIREIVVGTGGAALVGFSGTTANSQVRSSSAYGVLKLTLHPTSYDFSFVPIAGQSFTDSGTTSCHGSPSSAAVAASHVASDASLHDWAVARFKRAHVGRGTADLALGGEAR